MAERIDDCREVIFVGTIEDVGPPPAHWSGSLATYQEVRYRVDETVKGECLCTRMAVMHPVVRDSPTAQPGDAPGLSPRLFRCGARLMIIGVALPDGSCRATSEHFGALPYSRIMVERFRTAGS